MATRAPAGVDGAQPDRSSLLSRLNETQLALAAAPPELGAITALALERALELTKADGITFSTIEGDEILFTAELGTPEGVVGVRVPLRESAAGHAVETRRAYLIPRISEDPRPSAKLRDRMPDGSVVCVPLFVEDEPVGTLNASRRGGDGIALDDVDLQTLELLGGMVSSALVRVNERDALGKFAALFRDSPLGIALLSPDGTVLDMNQAFAGLLGREPGLPYNLAEDLAHVHEDDRAAAEAKLTALLTGAAESTEMELRLVRDGVTICIDGSTKLVRDAAGEPHFIVVMTQDVTQRRNAEAAQRRTTERLAAVVEAEREATAATTLDAASAIVARYARELACADGALVELLQDDGVVVRAAVGELERLSGLAADGTEAEVSLARFTNQLRVPVLRGDRTLGWLRVVAREDRWPAETNQALELLAVVLAAAVSRAAEAEARAIFEAVFYRDSPVGMGLMGLDGRLFEANDALVQESGCTREQLLSLSPEEYLYPDDFETLAADMPAMLTGELDFSRREHRLRPLDGVIRWKDSLLSFVRSADGTPKHGLLVSLDITERKQAELALREQTERLAAIVETQAEVAAGGADMGEVMGIVGSRALELTKAAGTTITMLDGETAEIRVGFGADAGLPGLRIPLGTAAMRHAIDTGRAVLIESTVDDARSSSLLVEMYGDISIVYVPVFRGTTATGCLVATGSAESPLDEEDSRTLELLGGILSSALTRDAELESERQRVETLARFEQIYRDAPIGIGMLNFREGPRWLGMNERMQEIRGFTADELNELDPSLYIHPDDGKELQRRFVALQRGETEREQFTLRQYRKDGTLVWTESSVSLVRDEHGEPSFGIVMVHDVTQSKLAEESLRRSSERLARIVETQADVAAAGSDLQAALQTVAERAHMLTRGEGAAVGLVEGDSIVIHAATGLASPHVRTRRPLSESVTGAAIAAGEAILISDARADERLNGELVRSTGERSHVCAPLFQGERVVGSLSIISASETEPLTEEDRQTLELLAVVLSSAVSRTAEVDALTKFELLYRGAPIGIGLMTPEGTFTETNDILCEILRCTRDELLSLPLGKRVHPEDRGPVGRDWRGLLAGEYDSYRAEHRLVLDDGGTVWINGAISLVREADGAPRFAIFMCQDATQRKQAELALQASNERLAGVLDTHADVAALGPDLDPVLRLIVDRVVALSRAEGASISLVDGEELVTRASTGIAADLSGYRRPLAKTLTAAAIRTGQSILVRDVEHDTRLYRPLAAKTGERSHICVPLYRGGRFIGSLDAQCAAELDRLDEDDLRILELLGVVLSSAISRQSESEALERFEAIFRDAPIGIGLLSLDGVFVDVNEAMAAMTGHELSDKPVSTWTHPDDVDELRRSFAQLVRGEIDSFRNESRYFRVDGGIAWVDAAVTLLRDPDGTPRFALSMSQDVTERRAAEEQLRQSQKIDAIGQLSAGIAHDFNNLLMGVLGYAGLARGELEPGSRVAEYLEKIETTGHRAASLTKQLLAFGRRQTLQPRMLDLNELIGETLSMLGRLLGEHIEIVPRLDPLLPQLRADPTQLQQVLFNLALNARDAMPGGGTLTIETQTVELGDAGGLELTPGHYVVLSVSDTGSGMSDEVRARIFEPFFTTKGVGEGTGLGLPSVYGIVKQSRGDIEVASRPLEGSTFRIYLPAAGPRGSAEPPGGPLGRVLLVEEAAVVRELVTTLLSEQGYDVVVASGPDDAVRLAREGETFDVLVTDLVLARTSGTHLAAQVQEHQPTVQVLYMSAYEPDGRVPAEAVIPKPFSNEALLARLDDLRASRPQR